MELLSDFHFLRPWWLLALVPAALLTLLLHSYRTGGSNWLRAIDSDLLQPLLDREPLHRSGFASWLLLLAWLLAVLALAGPVFRQLPQPLHEKEDALLVLLDLSLSMYAEDLKPDRLTQAKRKLRNLLEARKEGFTALIAYAGDAHTVTPLTDDTDTIELMLNSLAPDIMPIPGSRLAKALELIEGLIVSGRAERGRILVITDEITDPAAALEKYREIRSRFALGILGVGTPEGGAVSLAKDYLNLPAGYLKGRDGRLVLPQLDETSLRAFAERAGGRYRRITLSDADLEHLLAAASLPGTDATLLTDRSLDVWREEGPWLLLLLLPLAALGARRGWVWCLVIIMLLPPGLASNTALAADARTSFWRSLWSTPDQAAQTQFKRGAYRAARDGFQTPAWKAAAAYRAEDYTVAAEQFAATETRLREDPDARPEALTAGYNLGNALARQGRFAEAISAYDAVLEQAGEHEDAAFNKALIEELLREQQQQQEQQEQSEQSEEDQQEQQDDSGQQGNQASGDDASESEQSGEEQEETGQEEEGRREEAGEQEAAQQLAEGEREEAGSAEDREALEQWLRRVPDDPGGLLKEKFRRQARARLRDGRLEGIQEQPW